MLCMIQHIPALENERARLQPLQISDVEPLAAIALNQPDLFLLTSLKLRQKGDVYSFVRKALDGMSDGTSIPFLVIDKPSGKIAGTTRFLSIAKEHKRVEIGGTWIASEFHGNGLNKAMKLLMLQYAFETMDFNRVEFKINEINNRSRKAVESIGATFEGILRHHMINDDGTIRNSVYYSIIKEEWPHIKQDV